MERRLAAILAADVVGYSRLMEADEAGTLAAVKSHREALIEPKIGQYHGRIVKLMGDGLLAEFPSAVEAAQCAVEIQHIMAERNADVPEARRNNYRVGINIGDIVVEDDDIFGDGVNIAARLEGLAEPGGICISRPVHTQIKGKLDLTFEHLGEKEVKNITEPVSVYRVVLDEKAAALVTPLTFARVTASRGLWRQMAAGIVLSLAAFAGLAWWQPWAPDVEPASLERMTFPLPDRPSIAVLPFVNMSNDPNQDYFTDGLTEDIITGLSRFPDLFVVARNSAFSYKGQQITVKQIAEDLGVRYVLEGSVQRTANTIRVTAQLVDATTGHHLWAESYDRPLMDVFAVRDGVTQTIVATVMGDTGQLTRAEIARVSRKAPDNLRAYELVLKGVDIWLRFTPEANREAAVLFEKSISLDPGYARAYAVLAWVHLNDFRWLWSENPKKSLQLAYDMARKSLELDDTDDWSYWALGVIHLYRREYTQAEAAYQKALEINPNYADLLAHSGLFLTFLGKPDEAIDRIKTAMRLNPYYRAWYPSLLGWAQYLLGDYDAAVTSLKESIDRNPDFLEAHQHLAATFARLGRTKEASDEIARIVKMNPDISVAGIVGGLPFKNRKDVEGYLEGLRLAGLREELPLPLPDKPSIAVLPFDNLSGDTEQDYFADGLTDDLITDLSKVSDLFVIARNSTFVYKGQSPDVRQVANDLGVRYVLEGSVRRAGDQVRVNAQLIEADTGGHVWAERYDGSVADILSVQDSFVRKIVDALALNLSAEEQKEIARGQTANLDAREAFEKGWDHYLRFTPGDNAQAADYLLQAAKLDPAYGRAYSALGMVYVRGCQWRWNKDLGVSVGEANSTAQLYLSKGEKHSSSLTNVAASQIHLYNERHDKAFTEAARAVALDPNDPEAHVAMGLAMITTGRPEAGLKFVEIALRLNPSHPNHYVLAHGMAYFSMGDLEQAAAVLQEGLQRDPGAVELAPLLAAIHARLGHREEARAALQKWQPDVEESRLEDIGYTYHVPYKWADGQQAIQTRFIDGLLIAGLPLDVTVESLAWSLRNENVATRKRAALYLSRFGPSAAEAVPALIKALGDEDRWVQVYAVKALGRIGSAATAAIPALMAMQGEGAYASYVGEALKMIRGH